MKYFTVLLSMIVFCLMLFVGLLFRQVKILESGLLRVSSANTTIQIPNPLPINNEDDDIIKLVQKHQKDFFEQSGNPNGWLNFNNFLITSYKADWEKRNLVEKKGLTELHPSQQRVVFTIPFSVSHQSDQITEMWFGGSSTSSVYGEFENNHVTINIARIVGNFSEQKKACDAPQYKFSESEQRMVQALIDRLPIKVQSPDLCNYIIKRQLGHSNKEIDLNIRSAYWFNWGEYLKSNPAARIESDAYHDVIMFGVPNGMDHVRGLITLDSSYYADRMHMYDDQDSLNMLIKKSRESYKKIPQIIFSGLDFEPGYYEMCEYMCAY